ncbi:hypothetical protein C8R44DRAFT_761455, partial [Mycena epipterygia]
MRRLRHRLEEEIRRLRRWLDGEGLKEERRWLEEARLEEAGLEEKGRRLLIKAEIDRVMEIVTEQQLKSSCRCADCEHELMHKRTAFEDEVQILFNEYYDNLEQYTLNQQYLSSDGTLPLPSGLRVPGLFPGSIEYDNLANIVSVAGSSRPDILFWRALRDLDSEEKREHPAGEKYADGDMLSIAATAHVGGLGAILTVADDLFRHNRAQRYNDILKELHYRVEEKLAEFRLKKEGMRIFFIVTARMFKRQVFHHPEPVTKEQLPQLLRELKDEHKPEEAKKKKRR